jgi:hypothetical protein
VLFRSLGTSFCLAERHPRTLAPYLVIRYEDLVSQTEATMRRVADACELPWHPALLEPTLAGQAWEGNSSTRQGFQGISPAPLHRWEAEIRALETALVNRHLGEFMARWDYAQQQPAASPYWPVSGETPSRYLFNRMLLFYWKEFRL